MIARSTCIALIILMLGVFTQGQEPRWRHELRLGSDTDVFNYTDAANAQSLSFTSKWNERWTTAVTATWYERFGADAQRLTLRASRKIGGRSWISAAGGAGHDEGVIPKREAAFELGRAFPLPGKHLVRGVEVAYAQQWLWFRGSKVLVLSGSGLFYLPRDWTFTLTAAGARSSFHVPQIDWQPSGSARLSFPVHSSRVRATLSFSVGAENFAKADELGHFSARTFGGDIRYRFARNQDIGIAAGYQDRSQSRTQTSVGVSYGIRF